MLIALIYGAGTERMQPGVGVIRAMQSSICSNGSCDRIQSAIV
jgi:hypothetical protein